MDFGGWVKTDFRCEGQASFLPQSARRKNPRQPVGELNSRKVTTGEIGRMDSAVSKSTKRRIAGEAACISPGSRDHVRPLRRVRLAAFVTYGPGESRFLSLSLHNPGPLPEFSRGVGWIALPAVFGPMHVGFRLASRMAPVESRPAAISRGSRDMGLILNSSPGGGAIDSVRRRAVVSPGGL